MPLQPNLSRHLPIHACPLLQRKSIAAVGTTTRLTPLAFFSIGFLSSGTLLQLLSPPAVQVAIRSSLQEKAAEHTNQKRGK
jgi:hypothetical protein